MHPFGLQAAQGFPAAMVFNNLLLCPCMVKIRVSPYKALTALTDVIESK